MKRAEYLARNDNLRLARGIVNSDPVLRVFASVEWNELSDDGKEWIAAIVAETRRRAAEELTPRKPRRGNLSPAPFALTPSVVGRVLDAASQPFDRLRASGKVVDVPVLPTKLVDRPRRSEDPRLSRANDDTPFPMPSAKMQDKAADGGIEPARVAPQQAEKSAPAETPNLGRPGDAGTSGAMPHG